MTSKHRVWVSINRDTWKKFQIKFPNTDLNQWAKQIIHDILDDKKELVGISELKLKDSKIQILKLRLKILEKNPNRQKGESFPPLPDRPIATQEIEDG